MTAGCGAPGEASEPDQPVGFVEGWVFDASLRPVPGANVSISGIDSARTDQDGWYRIEASWEAKQLLILTEAEGFRPASQTLQPGNFAHRFHVNFTLARLPVDAWMDTQVFNGFIACGAIVQVGHSHGGGSPNDDNHLSCPISLGEGEQIIPYVPERDPDDMLIEVFWQANSHLAEFITVILYDEQGEVVQFDEGNSPLRLDVGSAHVKERFQDGRGGTIELRPGIADDDPPGEVYYAVHADQPFDVFATTSHGTTLTTEWSVAS